MLQEAESPPTFSKKSETMYPEEYTLTESISKLTPTAAQCKQRGESCIRLQRNVKNRVVYNSLKFLFN